MRSDHDNPAAANRKAVVKRSKTRAIGIAGQKRTTKKGDVFHYRVIDGVETLVKVSARGRDYEPLDYFRMKLGR